MICIFNANLIDNVSSSAHLACLCLKKVRGDCNENSDQAFEDFAFYEVVKIANQSRVCALDEIYGVFPFLLDFPDLAGVTDGEGDYFFPSFVDFHCHSEFLYLKNPRTEIRRDDLISDEIVGNCGISPYPVAQGTDAERELRENVLSILGDWPEGLPKWGGFGEFKAVFDSLGIRGNVLFLQGHSALRIAAMERGADRKASKKEILKMQGFLDRSLDEGAIGLSTGLYYAPCEFADEREILSLLDVVRSHNGLFAIHRREEGDRGLESTMEAIRFAKKAKVRLQISHLKAIGEANQEQIGEILPMIDRAYEDGLDIAFDQYPYASGSTSLESMLPPRILKDGKSVYQSRLMSDPSYRSRARDMMISPLGFDSIAHLVHSNQITIQYSDTFSDLIGKSFLDIARIRNQEPIDAILDLAALESGVCTIKDVTQSEENLVRIMSHPLSLYGTDALYAGNVWHERSRFSSRHMLREYSSRVGIERLVERATSQSAQRLGLKDRKIVKEGAVVQLVRFRI